MRSKNYNYQTTNQRESFDYDAISTKSFTGIYAYIYVCMYIFVYLNVFMYMYVCKYIYLCIYMCIYTTNKNESFDYDVTSTKSFTGMYYTCICVYFIHIYLYIYTYISKCIYICIYICIYMYIYA
jgi:hypothetical protein